METVGNKHVDCDCIDHTYVKTPSPGLDSLLKGKVAVFSAQLKQSTGLKSGQISLEVFQWNELSHPSLRRVLHKKRELYV